MKKTIYIAYGSNLNITQMARRCPTATVLTKGELQGYELVFRGQRKAAVATVEPKENCSVPIVLWELEAADERSLDVYEGYPWLYRKENLTVCCEGKEIEAMAYVMNEGREIGQPSTTYLGTIIDGYIQNGLDVEILKEYVNSNKEWVNESEIE